MDNQLTVADIANIKSLLEAACARGAFRANEMSHIGSVYDKLEAFLQQVPQSVTPPNPTPQGDSNA